jgi:hypothetical protein
MEFLRTWTAIGRAHVSASHGPDLFQLLDIASSNLVADDDRDDCGPLCTAHPSPAGSTSCTPNSIAAISASKPGATSTFLFGSSGLLGKRPASSGQEQGQGSPKKKDIRVNLHCRKFIVDGWDAGIVLVQHLPYSKQ